MGWAWFIPALTQLSLILPFCVLLYHKIMPNRTLLRILFAVMIILCAAINGFLTYTNNLGAMPILIKPQPDNPNQLTTVSFDYYNKVYMQSYFHLSSFLFGSLLAITYSRYLKELRANREIMQADANSQNTADDNIKISRSTRMFFFVSKNAGVRSLIYIAGLCTMFGTIFWLWPFLNNG